MNDKQITRSHFLKSNILLLTSFLIIDPFEKLFSNSNKIKHIPTWQEIIEIARWSPTVHNLQPHKLKIISETEAHLYYDPTRLLPVGDPNSIFATVAMGVFIENLAIVASSFEYKLEVKEINSPISINAKEQTKFASLTLISSKEKDNLDKDLILKRRTSRLQYNGKALGEDVITQIKNEALKFNHECFTSNNEDFIDLIIDLNQKTLFEDLESKENREELDKLFRYTDDEAKLKKDGLWATCMGFSGSLMKSIFKNHQKWEKGLRKKILSNHYKHSFNGTSTLCWFGGAFDNTDDWINAGRMFARNWLILTKENAYLQPFGSLITNKGAFEKINATLDLPKDEKKIWLIFRAGYSKEPARSFRLTTDEIIIK